MNPHTSPESGFNLNVVFEVNDHMYFYGDSLTAEHLDAQVASLVELLEFDSSMEILDLACGFGRHANRLAALGYPVTGVDYMPGFLDIARKDAAEMGMKVNYLQGDCANWTLQKSLIAYSFSSRLLAISMMTRTSK